MPVTPGLYSDTGELSRRAMMRGGATLALGSFFSTDVALAGQQPSELSAADPFASVAPELRPAAQRMVKMMEQLPLPSLKTLTSIRAVTALEPEPLRTIPVERKSVRRANGGEVAVFVINARAGEARPGILHMHGGGFVLGSAAAEVPKLQRLSDALDCVIVSAEYRLAPETSYLGSVEDNYLALSWMHKAAPILGLDPERIALMGESAGGGHAALLALIARDRADVPVLFQSLIYPALDDRTALRSAGEQEGPFGWIAALCRFGWHSFLGPPQGEVATSSPGVPARIENLAGLPPAFIGVGSVDLFLEENIEYGRRLIRAGVPTEILVVPGAFHGFDEFAEDTALAQRFTAAKIESLRRAFAVSG